MKPKNIGTCRLGEQIGQGGMAEVYRGFQETLERDVAVKALSLDLKEDEIAAERFRREALVLATLQHENIVAVHDLVEKYGRFYLIMEYVNGVDLSTVLEQGPVPVDIGLLIGSGLASALEHAHFRRVIHRDVKPGNVMLSRTGQVKLTDFGIAKCQHLDDLTRQGFVVGTLNYLSPEQIGGGRADRRSDIYALGVTLFEALSGVRPHGDIDGEQADVLASIINGQRKTLRQCAKHIPRTLEKIVHRCLELDPGRRYQRTADLRRDLEKMISVILSGSRSARLVSFLNDRNLLREFDESLLAPDELKASVVVESPETRLRSVTLEDMTPASRISRIVAIVVMCIMLTAGSLCATYLIAPIWSQQALQKLTVWLKNDTQPDEKSFPEPESKAIEPANPSGLVSH